MANLFIISGPSGSGKDTIINLLLQKNENLRLSKSCVTRPIRQGEEANPKYHYISVSEFQEMIEKNELLEYNIYIGNYYGTPKKPVKQWLSEGRDVILEIDVNGAFNIKKQMPDAILIFNLPPSFEILKNRLVERNTDSPEVIQKRLSEAKREIEAAYEYDYAVVNDDVDKAVEDYLAIIQSQTLSLKNKKIYINEVLENA